MHLLIINYEYPPVGAGASNASWFLARTLAREGNEVSVLTSAFKEYRGVSVEDGVRIHRIPACRKWIDRSNWRQMICFAGSGMVFASRLVRTEHIDHVIAFFTLPSGAIAYWLKARYGVPYLVSLRGGDVPGLIPELDRTHRGIGWLRRRILRSAQAIVANSPALAELSARTDPFPVTVVWSGVDGAMFSPRGADLSSDNERGLQILFVGRLQKQKNLELLLDELARLRREGVTAFKLHVAGDGPLRAAMRERAERLELGDRVVWHGWVAKPDLIELYRSADCFVNPSLYEGLPNTVLEAMACGLPVVASRVGGNEELVVDRETGLLFALDEPRALGSALEFLMSDSAAARRMGVQGRAGVVARFSWDAMASSYLRLLDETSPTGKD